MKKILVVGGAGYVGSVLVRELLERGYAVRVFDRLYYGALGIEDIKDHIELRIGDMRLITPQLLEDVTAVINVGGLSNDPTAEYNPQANYDMNTIAGAKLAQLCKQCGVKKYLYASSCSVYDMGEDIDKKDVVLDESSPVAPKAAYSHSKYEAEKAILALADTHFCPVVLRKGTIYGFSQRMRYDLVVNTFIKDSLSKGAITLFYGGQMWRPLIEVRDVAKAYILCVEAEEEKIRGQIFNVSYRNFRISEVAYRVRDTLCSLGVSCDIMVDYRYRGVRSYRVSTNKIETMLNFKPSISIEESVRDMVEKIKKYGYTDFDNPRYFNIQWFKVLEEAKKIIDVTGSVFNIPNTQSKEKLIVGGI